MSVRILSDVTEIDKQCKDHVLRKNLLVHFQNALICKPEGKCERENDIQIDQFRK